MPSWRSRTKTLCTSTLRGQTYELRWTEILRAPTAGRFTRSPVMSSPSHSSAHWTAVGRSTAGSCSTSSAVVIISPVGSGGPTSPSEPLALCTSLTQSSRRVKQKSCVRWIKAFPGNRRRRSTISGSSSRLQPTIRRVRSTSQASIPQVPSLSRGHWTKGRLGIRL